MCGVLGCPAFKFDKAREGKLIKLSVFGPLYIVLIALSSFLKRRANPSDFKLSWPNGTGGVIRRGVTPARACCAMRRGCVRAYMYARAAAR